MTTTFEIQVHDDHLARLAQVRNPVLGLAEIIWNALDADADNVTITLIDGKNCRQSQQQMAQRSVPRSKS